MKKNTKLIIILLIGVLIGSSIAIVIADTYAYYANQVSYDNANRTELSDNVQDALDELYDMAQNSVGCPNGYTMTSSSSYVYTCTKPVDLSFFAENATDDSSIDFSSISSASNGEG